MKQNYYFKRMLSALLLFFASTLAWAQDSERFEVDGINYFLSDVENEVMVIPGGNYSGDIVIPSTVSYDGKTYSVTSIVVCAFELCSSLTSIDIPESVTNIGWGAFAGCSSLTSINLPEGITYIGYDCFKNCSSLTTIDIPSTVTYIGIYAFKGCSSLTSINLPDGVTEIDQEAFSGCSSLTSIDIPESVTSIGEGVFYGCTSLTSIDIPEGVTSIGSSAFSGCSSLTSIDISKSVTNIGYMAFYGCTSLITAICHAENVPELGWDVFSYVPTSEATLYVPASALEAYKEADQWKEFGTILPLDGDATNISTTLQDKAGNAPYYTLDGKPAAHPTRKGIYVRDGKKVMVK